MNKETNCLHCENCNKTNRELIEYRLTGEKFAVRCKHDHYTYLYAKYNYSYFSNMSLAHKCEYFEKRT